MPRQRIELRAAGPDDAPRIEAFNRRMAAGGQAQHFIDTAPPFRTITLQPDSPIRLERILCVVDGEVRGAVNMKTMRFRLAGGDRDVTTYNYPVSEGIVDPKFAMVGLTLQREVLRRNPLAYCLGVGSLEEPVARLMRAGAWQTTPVPFQFRVFHPVAFLRNIVHLRKRRRWMGIALDFAAFSGAGWAGITAANVVRRPRTRVARRLVETVDTWGSWADALWERVRDEYLLIGDRSTAALRAMYPDGHPHLIRLRVRNEDGSDAGWAVVAVSRVSGHRHFGSMRLGSVVDVLAAHADADRVAAAAVTIVRHAGADLVVTNHSHARWSLAFERAGLMRGPTNFYLFLAPALARTLSRDAVYEPHVYFTRGDGDGPINLW